MVEVLRRPGEWMMRMVVVMMMMMISTEFFVKDGPLLDLQGEFSRASFPSTFAASSVTTLALAAALAAAAVRAAVGISAVGAAESGRAGSSAVAAAGAVAGAVARAVVTAVDHHVVVRGELHVAGHGDGCGVHAVILKRSQHHVPDVVVREKHERVGVRVVCRHVWHSHRVGRKMTRRKGNHQITIFVGRLLMMMIETVAVLVAVQVGAVGLRPRKLILRV